MTPGRRSHLLISALVLACLGAVVGGAVQEAQPLPHYFGPEPNWAHSRRGVQVFIEGGGGSGALATATVDPTTGGIAAITIDEPGAGYTSEPAVNILGGGGSGASASAMLGTGADAGKVTAAMVMLPGSGYNNFPGIRKFVDSLPGLGPAGANNLGQYIPVAIPDRETYPDADYYEIALVQYSEKMHSDLPETTLRGYVQLETDVVKGEQYPLANGLLGVTRPHYLGPMIFAQRDRPVRVKFTNALPTGADGDLFLPVDTTVKGAGAGPPDAEGGVGQYAQNRATIHLRGGRTVWISDGTEHQWITPAGEQTLYPKGVSVQNVPDMPDPGAGSMTLFYSNQQSARLMFYGDNTFGITRLNVYAGEAAAYQLTDPVEQDLIARGILPGPGIPLIIQDKTFVDAETVLATDPTWRWGTGAVNGTGGRAPKTGDLWLPHVYLPAQDPGAPDGMNPFGRWLYGPWMWPPYTVVNLPAPLPDGTEWPNLPEPSETMDAYMDTPVVNGTAYPYLEVEPRVYRFRILNGSNDRFWNLQLYQAMAGAPSEVAMILPPVAAWELANYPEGWPLAGDFPEGTMVPDHALAGPDMFQVGNDGGFLPAPVDIPATPLGFITDPAKFNIGNVEEHGLLLAPAERADILIDFSKFAGKTLILYNDACAGCPANDLRVDYYTGNPDLRSGGGTAPTLPGYGPNTRTIMQIRVANSAPAPALEFTVLEEEFMGSADAPGVFARSQDPIILPDARYTTAYQGSIYARVFPADPFVRVYETGKTFTGLGGNVTKPFAFKSIADADGESFEPQYGRQIARLGVELARSSSVNPTSVPLLVQDPVTENLIDSITVAPVTSGDGAQIWKITNNGVRTHPVHFHLFDVQLINRVAWDNLILPPDGNELGWKDTVRINPLEDTIVALRPVAPKMPFGVPDSIRLLDPAQPEGAVAGFTMLDPVTGEPVQVRIANRLFNFRWEYAWHSHALGSQDMAMLRPMAFAVATSAPGSPPAPILTGTAGNPVTLTWTDATPAGHPDTLGNPVNEIRFRIERAIGASGAFQPIWNALANETTFTDKTTTAGQGYGYRVVAVNASGEAASKAAPLGLTAPTAPSSLVAALVPGLQVVLGWRDNAADETGYVVERSTNGVQFQAIASVAASTLLGGYADKTVAPGNSYRYRVSAANGWLSSAYSNVASVSVPALPTAPSNLAASAARALFLDTVTLSWLDKANNESWFEIQRSTAPDFSTGVVTLVAGANATTIRDLAPRRVTYYYRVRAANLGGSSAWSNTVSVVTP